MSASRITPSDLIGATVQDARVIESEFALVLKGREGRRFLLTIMQDPEGNGPGSAHVNDYRTGEDLGCLGGR